MSSFSREGDVQTESNSVSLLPDIVELEEFKNCLPDKITTYINEQKVVKVSDAAVLADDYILTHKDFVDKVGFKHFNHNTHKDSESFLKPSGLNRFNRSTVGREDRVCHFCHKRGHVRADCFLFKRGVKQGQFTPKGAGLAAPVRNVANIQESTSAVCAYLPFIREGFVSLPGSNKKVPVKILRDTGAVDSFICADVLSFSADSETGTCIPVKGMGLNVFSVPLHKVMLECELFQGEALLAVRPALPIEGISVILGNGLVGNRLWEDVAKLDVLSGVLSDLNQQNISEADESGNNFPDVFVACTVTRSM
ncbi:uncharacterized protein LOC106512139, partial [Austrofundulus limnaeus]|uniref:Uncharacterized protein LOC106512139 n=1 Tax=Austrofundulus limnaeus TaxID=52670 RepID=A0A2I4ALA2_AUSLI